ncbi:MAG TPA: RNA polymerase sigma factor [Thermoanaerobaculia bacterium]|nr:RNA polymerase sigma factor [Thermoanaerobaculia bacterium]
MIDGMSYPLVILDTMMAERHAEEALAVMGDDEFRAFYERTARPLWAYLSRISGDPHKADDFLQEAYYRFYRASKHYESEAHRRNSLFQIATNLVRDAARRGKHYEEVPLADEGAPSAGAVPKSESPSPETEAAMRTDVARAIQQLEPVQRELLWLAYAQGSSHEEIAEILGLSAISVRTLLLRARRKLAGILAGGAR